MKRQIVELWNAREVIALLIRRELRLRYKNSAMGFVWSLVNPVAQCVMIWFVVRGVWNVKIPNYSAYLFSAFVPWVFFQTTLLDSCSSILYAGGLLKKIYFPREMLPIVTVGANFLHFLLSFAVFLIYSQIGLRLAYAQAPPIEWKVLLLPVIVLMMLLTATGFALMLSCLNVYFEDVKYMVQTFMAVLLFATPVIYQVDSLPKNLYVVSQLNPFGVVVAQFQKALLPTLNVLPYPRSLDLRFIAIGGLISVLIAIIGFRVFEKYKWDLAERL